MCGSETIQKPAQDVVRFLEGEICTSSNSAIPLGIDNDRLLLSFNKFEREYTSLLGDYLKPDADLTVLVSKTLNLASRMQPSDDDVWGDNIKKDMPLLLASIFFQCSLFLSPEPVTIVSKQLQDLQALERNY